ncbi:hypothetical protein ACFVOB_28520 [Streptomyces rochei]|uniref:hypothetical protein n=1 Tax=Streptomyces rochei TaxID=1928 RepID=UPI00369B9053
MRPPALPGAVAQWIRENVLPPAYRNETDWSCGCEPEMCWHCRDGQHDDCNSRTGWWRTGEAFRETEIADALGRRIGYEGSLVFVWLADRTCRQFGCICDCRKPRSDMETP